MILIVFWNGHIAWNWHLASFILIFERAGCPLYSYSFLNSATPLTPSCYRKHMRYAQATPTAFSFLNQIRKHSFNISSLANRPRYANRQWLTANR
ncbi:MAG: hypothetical protein F6K26_50070 [Moorea sp. SIO2I5]|nr:hypothetical protein [Moorena sp. SIO2I5]